MLTSQGSEISHLDMYPENTLACVQRQIDTIMFTAVGVFSSYNKLEQLVVPHTVEFYTVDKMNEVSTWI